MLDDLNSTNFVARGGMDQHQVAHILLEPRAADPRLERTALRLASSVRFTEAEELAERFNSGGLFAFKVDPDQVLKGAAIPQLFFADPPA